MNNYMIDEFDELFEIFDQINYDEEHDSVNNLENINVCTNCDTEKYLVEDNSNGIITCTNCGQVVDNLYDKTPEWRSYEDNTSSGHVRCSFTINPLMTGSSLGTSIGGRKSRIQMLQTWSSITYRDRRLHKMYHKIKDVCHKHGILGCIEDDAKILYKQISQSKHLEGDRKGKYIILRSDKCTSILAACVYFACKRKKETRRKREIASMFGIDSNYMTYGIKIARRLIRHKNLEKLNVTNSKEYIPIYCKYLNIDKKYIQTIYDIIDNINKLKLCSRHTTESIAVGSVMLLNIIEDLKINKKTMAKELDVSDVTLTKIIKVLLPYSALVMNNHASNIFAEKLEIEKKKIKKPELLTNHYNEIQ